MRKLFLCAVLLCAFSAWGQLPDCSKGFCAGIGSPMSPHISCKAGYKYTQLDAPGTSWSCTGVPPDWVQDSGSALQWYVPVEKYGAVGDGVTNDYAAIQACLNSLTAGQCVLQAKTYFIGTNTLSITKSNVGFLGQNNIVTYAPQYPTPSGSVILSSSPSADIIDAWGTSTAANIYGNKFQNFTLVRNVVPNGVVAGPPSTGPAGLSLKYSYGAVIDGVTSEDSGFGFFFHAVGSQGTGYFNNNVAQFGDNGVTETSGNYSGFWFDSVNGEASPSVRMTNNFVHSTFSPFSVNALGWYFNGSAFNDFMGWNGETSGVNYGVSINATGVTGIGAQDMHFRNFINDTNQFSCFYITGATTAMTSTIDIDGGWCEVNGQTSPGVHILGSNNVVVRNVQITGNGGMNYAIQADTTSGNVSLLGNNILTPTGGISLVGGSDYTVKDNLLHSSGSGPLVSMTSSPAHISMGGNVYSGTGTGVSIAAGTSDVKGLDADVFDTTLTTSITSAIPFLTAPIGSETVTFSATPTFSNITRSSIITLTGNVTSFTLAAGVDGQQKTLTFCQDSTGSRTVAAPANVHGFTTIGSTLSKCSAQSFTYSAGQSAWLANGTGVINQ